MLDKNFDMNFKPNLEQFIDIPMTDDINFE